MKILKALFVLALVALMAVPAFAEYRLHLRRETGPPDVGPLLLELLYRRSENAVAVSEGGLVQALVPVQEV